MTVMYIKCGMIMGLTAPCIFLMKNPVIGHILGLETEIRGERRNLLSMAGD